MVSVKGLFAIIGVLISGTCFAQTPPPSATTAPAVVSSAVIKPDYRVGEGDIIKIDVFGESDLSKEYRVDSSGSIEVPMLGLVRVKGKTIDELRHHLDDRLRGDYIINPQITTSVVRFGSQRIEIYGAITNPGSYFLGGNTRLLEILAKAGWLNSEKSSRQVSIIRSNGDELIINLDNVLNGTGENLFVKPGDVMTVFEGLVVYVSGEVNNPQAITFQDGLTVTQALTKAGGPNKFARLRGAYVLRDGEQKPVNLKRIIKGKDADLMMMPGDQLIIKESPL